MIGSILAVVLALGVILQAHEHKTKKTKNEFSTEREYSAAATAYDFDQSEMEFIQKVLAQLSATKKDKDDEVGSRSSNSDEEKTPLKIDVADSLDSSESKEIGRSVANNYNSKQSIVEYLSETLNRHRNGETKPSRRLDIEDNGDDFSDLVDIDNPNSNDYNQDDIHFKANRNSMGHEAYLDMKGRSGFDGSIPRNIFSDRALYRPPMNRRGLLITPGFYQYPTPPSITFNKIDNRDLLHPMGLLNSLPFRRLENQVGELPTARVDVASTTSTRGDVALPKADVTSTRAEESSTRSEGSSTWDPEGNAYQYEPEDGLISTPLWNGR